MLGHGQCLFCWVCIFPHQAGTKQSVGGQVPPNRPCEGKSEETSEAVQSIAVRQKLKELESEIDKFRGENAALAKMRVEREEVRNKEDIWCFCAVVL